MKRLNHVKSKKYWSPNDYVRHWCNQRLLEISKEIQESIEDCERWLDEWRTNSYKKSKSQEEIR